ncbi:MAG: carboxypeptidase-like regulatory domain-containing protein [Janthinobacterium lividum]
MPRPRIVRECFVSPATYACCIRTSRSAEALNPGDYTLSATATGFAKYVAQSISLQVDENHRIVIKLNVGEVTQQVTVSGQAAAQVETRTSTIGEVVDSERVRELPLNGRNAL